MFNSCLTVLSDREAHSVARPTQEPEAPKSIDGPAVYFPFSDSRRAVVSYWRKYVHLVLVNRRSKPAQK